MSLPTHMPQRQSNTKSAPDQNRQRQLSETEMPQIDLQRTPAQILHLQRTIGNQAAMRLLGAQPRGDKTVVQRKFKLDKVEYSTEEEAEELARKLYNDHDLYMEDIDEEAFVANVIALAISDVSHGNLSEQKLVNQAKEGLGKVEEKREVDWVLTGTYAVISGKALSSLPTNCKQSNVQIALDSEPLSGGIMGEWNSIKQVGTGIYELKIAGSKTMRCMGTVGDSGKIEFKNPAEKGVGK